MAQIHYQNAPTPNLSGAAELYMKALNNYNPANDLVSAMDAIKQRAQAQNAEDVYARASQITDAGEFAKGLQDGSIVQPESSIFGVSSDVYKDLMAKRESISKAQVLQKAYEDSVLDDMVANNVFASYQPAYALGNNGQYERANALVRDNTKNLINEHPEWGASINRQGFAKYFNGHPWETLRQADRHHLDNLALNRDKLAQDMDIHNDNLALGREKLATAIESNRLKAQANAIKANQKKPLTEPERKLLEQQQREQAQGLGLQLAKMYPGGDTTLEQFLAWGNKNYDPIKQVFHGVDADGNPIEVPLTPAQHAYIFASEKNPLLSAFQAQSEINRGKLAKEYNDQQRAKNEEQYAKDLLEAKVAAQVQQEALGLNPHSNDNYNQEYGFENSRFIASDEAKDIADNYDKWGSGGVRTTEHEASPKVILAQMETFNDINEKGPSIDSVKAIEKSGSKGIPLEQFMKMNGRGDELVPDTTNGLKIKYNEAKSGLYIRRNPETNRTEIIDRKKAGTFARIDPRNYDWKKGNLAQVVENHFDFWTDPENFKDMSVGKAVRGMKKYLGDTLGVGIGGIISRGSDNISSMDYQDRRNLVTQLNKGLRVEDSKPQTTTPAQMIASKLWQSPYNKQVESVTPTIVQNRFAEDGTPKKFEYNATTQNELKAGANMNNVLAQDKVTYSGALNEISTDTVDSNLVVDTKDGLKFTGGTNLHKMEAKANKVIDNYEQNLSGDPQIRIMQKVTSYNGKNFDNKFKDPAVALMEMNGVAPGDKSMDPQRIHDAVRDLLEKMGKTNYNPDAMLYALNFALQRQDNDHWINSGSSYSKGKTGIGEGWSIDDQAFITGYNTYSEARTRYMDQSYKYEQAKKSKEYFDQGKQNYVNSRYNKDRRETAKQQLSLGVETIEKLGASSIKDRLILEKKQNH